MKNDLLRINKQMVTMRFNPERCGTWYSGKVFQAERVKFGCFTLIRVQDVGASHNRYILTKWMGWNKGGEDEEEDIYCWINERAYTLVRTGGY